MGRKSSRSSGGSSKSEQKSSKARVPTTAERVSGPSKPSQRSSGTQRAWADVVKVTNSAEDKDEGVLPPPGQDIYGLGEAGWPSVGGSEEAGTAYPSPSQPGNSNNPYPVTYFPSEGAAASSAAQYLPRQAHASVVAGSSAVAYGSNREAMSWLTLADQSVADLHIRPHILYPLEVSPSAEYGPPDSGAAAHGMPWNRDHLPAELQAVRSLSPTGTYSKWPGSRDQSAVGIRCIKGRNGKAHWTSYSSLVVEIRHYDKKALSGTGPRHFDPFGSQPYEDRSFDKDALPRAEDWLVIEIAKQAYREMVGCSRDPPGAMTALVVPEGIYLASSLRGYKDGMLDFAPFSAIMSALGRCAGLPIPHDFKATTTDTGRSRNKKGSNVGGTKQSGSTHERAGNCGEPCALHMYWQSLGEDAQGGEHANGTSLSLEEYDGNLLAMAEYDEISHKGQKRYQYTTVPEGTRIVTVTPVEKTNPGGKLHVIRPCHPEGKGGDTFVDKMRLESAQGRAAQSQAAGTSSIATNQVVHDRVHEAWRTGLMCPEEVEWRRQAAPVPSLEELTDPRRKGGEWDGPALAGYDGGGAWGCARLIRKLGITEIPPSAEKKKYKDGDLKREGYRFVVEEIGLKKIDFDVKIMEKKDFFM